MRPVGNDGTTPGYRAELSRVNLDEDGPEWAILRDGDLSETNQRYHDFFRALLGDLRSAGFTDRTTVRTGQSQSFPSAYPGAFYNAGFLWDTPMVFLWVSAGAYDKSVRIYDALCRYKEELECELKDLQFDVVGQLGGWRQVSLGMTLQDGHIAGPDEKLDEIRAWMSDAIVRLKEAVEPRLEKVMGELQPNAQETTQ